MSVADMVSDQTVMDDDAWVRAAQASIRRFCGWHVAPVITEELRLNGHGGRSLTLPTLRLTGVESVAVRGVEVSLELLDWGTDGTVQLRDGVWPVGSGTIAATITHGFAPEDVPDVVALIFTLAKRGRSGAQRGALSSRSVNGASESYMAAGGAPLSVPLLSIEKEALRPYRLTRGPL